MKLHHVTFAAVLASASALAQPQFEVASVKPSGDQAPEQMSIGVHLDGAQAHIAYMSLADYVRFAYQVKPYQVTGPDWIGSTRFDIDAKLPAGAKRDQIPDMLKALLADRFQLKLHKSTKEFPVYGISVAPGGLKVTETPADDTPAAAVEITGSGSRDGVNLNYADGSYFHFADNKLEIKGLTMGRFAEMLGRFVDKPVIDMSGRKGTFEFSIPLAEEDYRAMLIRSALSAGVTLPPQALLYLNGVSDASLFNGLNKLGLKLEPRKAPLEILVVDDARRTPTDN